MTDSDPGATAPPSSLTAALEQFGVEIPPDSQAAVQRYVDALWDVNQRINLTRHTDYGRFVTRDVLDAVKLAEHIEPSEEVLDVGSGGGVPGVLLAALRPDLQVSLCESVQKKAAALTEIVEASGLPVAVHHARAESLLEDFRFHSLTARAVAAIPKLLKWFESSWSGFDRLLLIKGPKWIEERGAARHQGLMQELQLRRLATYSEPQSGAESVILEIRRKPLDQKPHD